MRITLEFDSVAEFQQYVPRLSPAVVIDGPVVTVAGAAEPAKRGRGAKPVAIATPAAASVVEPAGNVTPAQAQPATSAQPAPTAAPSAAAQSAPSASGSATTASASPQPGASFDADVFPRAQRVATERGTDQLRAILARIGLVRASEMKDKPGSWAEFIAIADEVLAGGDANDSVLD